MDEAVERLTGAFRLVEIDLEHPTRNRVASAQREVGRFLLTAPRGVPGAGTSGVWFGSGLTREPSLAELLDIQTAVRGVLDGLLSTAPVTQPPDVTLTFTALLIEGGGVVVKVVEGTLRDRVVGALLLLLASAGAPRLRSCRYCRRAILKIGRREYCERPDCQRQRRQQYWDEYKSTPEAEQARLRYYEAHGWTRGARATKRTVRKRRKTNKGVTK
jgi:hypothetical protein